MKDNFWIIAAYSGLMVSLFLASISLDLYHDRNTWRMLSHETCKVLLNVTEQPRVPVDTVWIQPIYIPVVYERVGIRDSVLMRMYEEARQDAALYRGRKHD